MVATGVLKHVEVGAGVKVSEMWITQWRSWSRLSKWMSAHGLDLKFETHVLALPVFLSVFVSIFLILFFFYYLFLYYSLSVMVLTQLAFTLVICIFSSVLIICNFF